MLTDMFIIFNIYLILIDKSITERKLTKKAHFVQSLTINSSKIVIFNFLKCDSTKAVVVGSEQAGERLDVL